MNTLVDRLEWHAARTPDKPYVVLWEEGKYRPISFRNFQDLTRSIGFFIKTQLKEACAPGSLAFVILKHGDKLHATFIACMQAAMMPSYLPFPTPKQDPTLYFESHRQLFKRTKPAAIITYAALVEPLRRIAPAATKIITIDDYVHEGYLPASVGRSGKDIALLQHSSGTTGLKKGVQLTFEQIAQQADAYAECAGLDAESVVASWLPLYHDMGLLTSFLIPLHLGCSVVSLDAFEWVRDPVLLLRVMEMFNVTHTWLPNFSFAHILNVIDEEQQFSLPNLKAIISCSEPVKPATMAAFGARFAASGASLDKLQGCYAMAETVFAVSQFPIGCVNHILSVELTALSEGRIVPTTSSDPAVSLSLVSNGQAVSGIEIAILNDNGGLDRALDSPSVGEIVVRGEFVFDGYYKNPKQTASAFHEGWYKTGDLGFLRQGELYICGRIKDVLIIHGRNYYSHDVEEVASLVPNVIPGRAVAVGVDDAGSGSEELLVIAETSLLETDTAGRVQLKREVKRAIFDRLELTPKDVILVNRGWLVKTTSGKISRVENLKRYRIEAAARRLEV